MANTLTLNTVNRVGNQQFQGLYNDMWQVKATITDTDAVAISDTLVMTITVPGVVLGDHVLGYGITADQNDGTDQAVITFAVTAANTVSMFIHADVGEFAADAMNAAVVKLLVGRPSW